MILGKQCLVLFHRSLSLFPRSLCLFLSDSLLSLFIYMYIYKGWLKSSTAKLNNLVKCNQMMYIFQSRELQMICINPVTIFESVRGCCQLERCFDLSHMQKASLGRIWPEESNEFQRVFFCMTEKITFSKKVINTIYQSIYLSEGRLKGSSIDQFTLAVCNQIRVIYNMVPLVAPTFLPSMLQCSDYLARKVINNRYDVNV